jgi:repressor LexA
MILTERQQEILDFIHNYSETNGFPPSIREIGSHFKVYPATIQDHIAALEKKGFLRKKRFQSRTLAISDSAGYHPDHDGIPIVGRVAAGAPLLATENIEDTIHLPKDWAPAGAFLLKVAGDSMVGAHILDGDYVLVHPQKTAINGEIVVALIGDEATVKRFYRRRSHITLKAENPKFDPIELEDPGDDSFQVVGKVMGVLRVMKR